MANSSSSERKPSFLYMYSCFAYRKYNLFKFGKSVSVKTRSQHYNTSHLIGCVHATLPALSDTTQWYHPKSNPISADGYLDIEVYENAVFYLLHNLRIDLTYEIFVIPNKKYIVQLFQVLQTISIDKLKILIAKKTKQTVMESLLQLQKQYKKCDQIAKLIQAVNDQQKFVGVYQHVVQLLLKETSTMSEFDLEYIEEIKNDSSFQASIQQVAKVVDESMQLSRQPAVAGSTTLSTSTSTSSTTATTPATTSNKVTCCQYVLVQGKNKGKFCTQRLVPNQNYCNAHKKTVHSATSPTTPSTTAAAPTEKKKARGRPKKNVLNITPCSPSSSPDIGNEHTVEFDDDEDDNKVQVKPKTRYLEHVVVFDEDDEDTQSSNKIVSKTNVAIPLAYSDISNLSQCSLFC